MATGNSRASPSTSEARTYPFTVIPAKAGIPLLLPPAGIQDSGMPAFAGMTGWGYSSKSRSFPTVFQFRIVAIFGNFSLAIAWGSFEWPTSSG